MLSKNKPLSKAELAAHEAKRDLAAELLESIHQMKAGQTQVVTSPVIGGPRRFKTAIQRKKKMIWHCFVRNALIARVAEAFAAKDQAALRGLGLKLAKAFYARPSPPHVTILVEGIGHAETLDNRLDGWILAATPHGLDDAGEPSEPADDLAHEVREPNQIMTLMYARKHGIMTDVLIRATGGMGKLNWSEIRSRSKPNSLPRVVDFEDRFDPLAENDSMERMSQCRCQGMRIREAVPTGT